MTVKSVILLILGGVLANNFVFEKFLGLTPLLGFAKKDNKLTALGLSVFVVILLTSPLTWAVQSYVLAPAGLEALQLLVFVALILCVVWLVELIAKAIFKKGLGVYFPVIALNSAVLGLAVSNVSAGLGFVEAQLTAVGVGLGFWAALYVFSGLREKIDEMYVPKAFRGLPIELMAAGIVSMALLAFK